MNYYNKKCLGCGQFFSNDINSPSYVKNPNENTKFCKRCFQLKHYGTLNNSNVNQEQIEDTLLNIDFSKGSIILIVDLFDIKNSLLNKFKDIKNLLLVVNKSSFLKSFNKFDYSTSQIKEYINKLEWKNKIIFYDSINKFNVNKIDQWIKKESSNNKKVYIVGNTNVGKSSLINALLLFNKQEPNLSVSSIKNTTLNLSKVVLDKYTYVIDTPGFVNDQNLLSCISTTKKLNFKKYHFMSFALKDDNQMFYLENLIKIKNIKRFSELKNATVQFYIPDNFKVHRTNCKNELKIEAIKQEFFDAYFNDEFKEQKTISFFIDKIDTKYLVSINGLGFLVLKNIKEFELTTSSKINFDLLDFCFI